MEKKDGKCTTCGTPERIMCQCEVENLRNTDESQGCYSEEE